MGWTSIDILRVAYWIPVVFFQICVVVVLTTASCRLKTSKTLLLVRSCLLGVTIAHTILCVDPAPTSLHILPVEVVQCLYLFIGCLLFMSAIQASYISTVTAFKCALERLPRFHRRAAIAWHVLNIVGHITFVIHAIWISKNWMTFVNFLLYLCFAVFTLFFGSVPALYTLQKTITDMAKKKPNTKLTEAQGKVRLFYRANLMFLFGYILFGVVFLVLSFFRGDWLERDAFEDFRPWEYVLLDVGIQIVFLFLTYYSWVPLSKVFKRAQTTTSQKYLRVSSVNNSNSKIVVSATYEPIAEEN